MRTWMIVVLALAVAGCAPDVREEARGRSAQEAAASASAPSPRDAPTATTVTADRERTARLFLRFARGEATSPPIDTPVNLYLGGRLTEVLSNHDAGRREEWRTCPDGGPYAGALCPFSAVDLLSGYDGRIVVTRHPPSHPCAHPAHGPSGRSVTLTPSGPRTCVDYWAVQLWVNDVGQVTDVNVVLAEP
ncbi:hypothetical protein [Nocardioides sp. YIM 152315]|uniref:hypothetical protein n=1 Tax=Nocardioides sp. YIM 152315 TaxID=3031760 RepID=UPI0023D9A6AB|nr:hypothetical protein [Nocardioides sp. YIM 152315]MDF1602406.1 hypothetical protein [Nocardioides sp. YIM 152315]